MASRAELLDRARKERQQREVQRQVLGEKHAREEAEVRSVAAIQRIFRGLRDVRQWREVEWKSLKKQASDLDTLGRNLSAKGQIFVPPCKVLLPLLCRAVWLSKKESAADQIEVCSLLAPFVVAGFKLQRGDALRSLREQIASTDRPLHVPDPGRIVAKFSETLLRTALAGSGAGGLAEYGELLEVAGWGEEPSERLLTQRFLRSSLNADHLKAWRGAATSGTSVWPSKDATAAPRLQGLATVAAAWLRLVSRSQKAARKVGVMMQNLLGAPRVAPLLATLVTQKAHLPPVSWATLLGKFETYLRRLPKAAADNTSLVFACGNLWELQATIGLPLDDLLPVQASLSSCLEVSMLPGFSGLSGDDSLSTRHLREQLRHFTEPSSITQLFGSVFHFRAQPGDSRVLTRHISPYQRHCGAVALGLVKPFSVLNLCEVYSKLLLKARTAMRAHQSTGHTQVYFAIANAIAYMERGACAKSLWRFLTAFCEVKASPEAVDGQTYHGLFLLLVALMQLLGVMSPMELMGGEGPLCQHDVGEFIQVMTSLVSRLIWTEIGSGDKLIPGVPPTLIEGFEEQASRVLNHLHSLATRLNAESEREALSQKLWHGPDSVTTSFHEAINSPPTADGRYVHKERVAKLLRLLPHSIPFEERVALLRSWIARAREATSRQDPKRVVIRRTHIFEDGLVALASVDWRRRFQVVFINEHGVPEEGQDIGGLFKEFWEKLAETAFDPNYGLFRSTESRLLYPNPEASTYHSHALQLFEFLGLVIGKAIYEGIVVEPCFAPFFLAKLLGRHNSYYDLQTLDPALFANLQRLKSYTGDVSDLCCSFVATTSDGQEVPLMPNGAETAVTNENRFRYVYLLSDYKLNVELRDCSNAFLRGFQRLLEERWFRMFGEQELQQIISGSMGSSLDIQDLQKNTLYQNCRAEDRYSTDFFKALAAMEPKKQVMLLRFVTSCSRTPLLGFGHLVPPFTLVRVDIRRDGDKLPTAATCFNALKLPTYSSWKVTRAKLEFVIEQGAGFDLA